MNKRSFHSFFVIAFTILISNFAIAQVEDFQSWNNIGLEKAISKKISLNFQQDLRFQNNASLLKDYITVIGGQYAFNKYVKVRGLYRLTISNDIEDGQEYEHRWYADAMFRYKFKRFIFGYRPRYQLSYQDMSVNHWQHIRNRLTIKYDVPKSSLVPYAQCELYYSLNNPVKNSFDKTRYSAGLEYGVNDYLSFRAFYRVQIRREYGRTPKNTYILGLGASFDI